MTDSDWTERQEDLLHILDRALYYAARAVIDADRANETPDLGTLHSVLTAEVMVFEGEALTKADERAWSEVSGGHDRTLRWATEQIKNYQAARARSFWETYRAEDLVRIWAEHKERTHETREDTERILRELREFGVVGRSLDELAELVEFVPGSLEEIREVLYRRYADR